MSKGLKKAIIIIAAVLVLGLAIGGFFIIRHNAMYISKDEALSIAVTDISVDPRTITDTSVEFEKTPYAALYDIEVEAGINEYEYTLDATTGEILSSSSKVDR